MSNVAVAVVLAIRAVEDAQSVLADYVDPSKPTDAETTINTLLSILDNKHLVASLRGTRETSPEIASLAAKILAHKPPPAGASIEISYDWFMAAQRVAGSALGQRELAASDVAALESRIVAETLARDPIRDDDKAKLLAGEFAGLHSEGDKAEPITRQEHWERRWFDAETKFKRRNPATGEWEDEKIK